MHMKTKSSPMFMRRMIGENFSSHLQLTMPLDQKIDGESTTKNKAKRGSFYHKPRTAMPAVFGGNIY